MAEVGWANTQRTENWGVKDFGIKRRNQELGDRNR